MATRWRCASSTCCSGPLQLAAASTACLTTVFPTKPLLTVGAAAFAAFLPTHVAMNAVDLQQRPGLAERLLPAIHLCLFCCAG
jgi:hypothetical protein